MNNKSRTFITMFGGTLLCVTGSVANAEIVTLGDTVNAFLFGTNIEVGIGANGAIGSEIKNKQEGTKSYNSSLGLVTYSSGANDYNGDFVLDPVGGDEENWGVSFNGSSYNNNNKNVESEISGELSDFKSANNTQSVVWTGAVNGLEITKIYRTYSAGTALIIDVRLKNISQSEMTNVYYMRSVNPQNNAEFSSKYETLNTIVSQGNSGSGMSVVSAKQDGVEGSYSESILTLNGYAENSHVTYGGLENRDPVAIYTGGDGLVHSVGQSELADKSISIAFKYDRIVPGETVKLRMSYQLADVSVATIDLDKDDSSNASSTGYKQLYVLGDDATNITDTDVLIESSATDKLLQAVITITNPHDGDRLEVLGTLPSGIVVDTATSTASNQTELMLTGEATLADYQTALKQIQFKNTNTQTNLDSRKILIQVIDKEETPSSTAISTICLTIAIELENPDIAGDNVVDASEVNAVSFNGHAAPNAKVTVNFVDKNGKILEKIVSADDDGNWSIAPEPADLAPLSDGPIKIELKAEDDNGNISTLTKEVIKDTQIILENITPTNNQVVSGSTPTYKGDTDPNASVKLKILPNGKEYSTTADADGKWEIQLDSFPMDTTQDVKITALDDHENQATALLTFKTANLPIDVTELDADNNGLAHSTTPTLKGTSNPNTKITIVMPTTDGKSTECSTDTDSSGNWVCKLPISPSGGPYTALITTTDAEGNKNSTSRQLSIPDLSLAISSPLDEQLVSTLTPEFIGTTDPAATVKLEVLPNGKVYTTTADENGNWKIPLDDELPKGETVSVKVTATDDADNETTITQSVKTASLPIEITDLHVNSEGMASSTTPTIEGTSDPSTTIRITMPTNNGDISCDTTTDSEGKWSCTLPVSPTGGPYTLTAVTTDGEGNTNSTDAQISIPELPLIIDSPANNAVISGVDPVVSGTSKPGSKVEVTVSDGKTCTAVTDASNHWSCQLPTLAFDNDYTLTVTAEDEIGNKSTEVVNVSTNKLPLSIISPKDNSTTEDTTPTFIGTTLPNANVTVTVSTGQTCSAKADTVGRWSCELPAMPVGGPYDVNVKAVDSKGNQTSLTEKISIPKVSLLINEPADGEVIKANELTVTGNSDPNTAITVFGADGEQCETTSDATGAWSCKLDNVQSGKGKRITVFSGDNQKVAIRTVDIENSSDKVRTVLSGSVSIYSVFLFGLFLLLNFFRKSTMKDRDTH